MSRVVDGDFGRGAYGARHSMPLQCHMTIPRQYIGPDGRVLLPGNSARNAISEEFARAAIASRRKSIGKAGVCRTEGTQFKPKSSIDSGKQEKEEDDKRRMPEGGVCTSYRPEARPRPVPLHDETGSVRPRARQTRSGDKALS